MKHQAISFARTKHGSILLNMSPHHGTCPFERQRLQTHMGDVVPSNRLSAIAISQQVTLAQSFNVPPVRHPWLPQGSPWERWRHTAFILDQISNDCDYNRLNIYIYLYIYIYDYDYINLYHVISNVSICLSHCSRTESSSLAVEWWTACRFATKAIAKRASQTAR